MTEPTESLGDLDGIPPPPGGPAAGMPKIPDVSMTGVIGRGGMGAVYKGRQTYIGRDVAVKVMHPDVHAGPEFAARFQREATILAGLTDPHIVSCYHAGVTDAGQCYLVMEYVDGPNVSEWLRENGKMAPRHALELCRDIATALQSAYESQKIIHRDVKGSNILLQPRASGVQAEFPYTAKLADLGLARAVAGEPLPKHGTDLTAPGTVLGSPSTMSPEQFNDPEAVDHRADIYGLGCVVYQALTGKPAFEGDDYVKLMAQKEKADGPNPCDDCKDVPPALGALVTKMMAYDKERRPQGYRTIIEACNRLLGEAQTPAWIRMAWVSVAAVALIVAAAIIAVSMSSRSDDNAETAGDAEPIRVDEIVVGEDTPLEGGVVSLTAAAQLPGETEVSCEWSLEPAWPWKFEPSGLQAKLYPVRLARDRESVTVAAKVTAAGRVGQNQVIVDVKADPAGVALSTDQVLSLFVKGMTDKPLDETVWTKSVDGWWGMDQDDDLDGFSGNLSGHGDTTQVRLLPRGAWKLTGKYAATKNAAIPRAVTVQVDFGPGDGYAVVLEPQQRERRVRSQRRTLGDDGDWKGPSVEGPSLDIPSVNSRVSYEFSWDSPTLTVRWGLSSDQSAFQTKRFEIEPPILRPQLTLTITSNDKAYAEFYELELTGL